MILAKLTDELNNLANGFIDGETQVVMKYKDMDTGEWRYAYIGDILIDHETGEVVLEETVE